MKGTTVIYLCAKFKLHMLNKTKVKNGWVKPELLF